jgi:ribosome-binding protein aMBF1 (putative translation factor)
MRADKRKKLEAQGWKLGSAEEFLQLSPCETAYIEMKLALGSSLRQHRLKRNLSQVQLAQAVQSSQSRVARMEAGDPSVSIDLLVKSLLLLGASPKELARTIAAG